MRTKAEHNQYHRDRRTRLRAEGKCIICGRLSEGRSSCLSCLQKAKRGDHRRAASKAHKRNLLKQEVFSVYGTGCCNCCEERQLEFLVLDHINGNVPERQAVGKKLVGESLYRHLKREQWPSGYQVLCANCNTAVKGGRTCPHKL